MEKVLGIDIGGTNIRLAIVDELGNLENEHSFETASFAEAEELVLEVYKLDLEKFESIGIGAPNASSLNGKIELAPNLNWGRDIPIKAMFENLFKCNVAITNDANAAALGEKRFGLAKEMSDFVMITLGTGLGSGIIVNDQLVLGQDGHAGELGHTIAVPNGRLCACGRKGCLETYVSARGIKQTATEYAVWFEYDSPLKKMTSDMISSVYLHQLAKEGDQLAMEVYKYTARILASALANCGAILSPEAFIFSGGVAHSADILLPLVKEYMEESLLPVFKNKIKIEKSALNPDHVGILGAAALAM